MGNKYEHPAIQIAGLWQDGRAGVYRSMPLTDDVLLEFWLGMRERPYRFLVRLNERRRTDKAPHAFLLAVPIEGKK